MLADLGLYTGLLVVVAVLAMLAWRWRSLRHGPSGHTGVLRRIAHLSLSPSQRVVTVEVGAGDSRRWLVLGVSPAAIQLLATLDAPPLQEAAHGLATAQETAPAKAPPGFRQLLQDLRQDPPQGGAA